MDTICCFSFQHMRDLNVKAGGQIDPSAYHEAIRVLETEVDKMKNLYESELANLRYHSTAIETHAIPCLEIMKVGNK